jgi:hypothetical protein
VRDFLLTQEMQKEFLKYPICQSSPLKGLCMAHLALFKIWPPNNIDDMIKEVISWAKKCEDRESITPLEVLDDLESTKRAVMERKYGPTGSPRLDSRRVLRRAARLGLNLYVRQCADRDPSCSLDIWEAILPREHVQGLGILEKVSMLLTKGFDPNNVSNNLTRGDSPHNKACWQQFLQISRDIACPGLAKLLLLSGADPDVQTMGSNGCLYDIEREIDSWLAEARARKFALISTTMPRPDHPKPVDSCPETSMRTPQDPYYSSVCGDESKNNPEHKNVVDTNRSSQSRGIRQSRSAAVMLSLQRSRHRRLDSSD